MRQIAREEIDRLGTIGTYNTLQIPRHIHNGVDSPLLIAPTLTYGGYVFWNGVIAVGTLMPKGWTVQTVGTGIYTVVHNLNTQFYIPSASAIQSTNKIVTTVISPTVNDVTFTWFDMENVPAKVDTGFSFLIITVTNTVPGSPQYQTVE